MKILLINKFLSRGGGADCAFLNTADLLKAQGHEVIFFSMQHPGNLATEYDRYFLSSLDFDRRGISAAVRSSLRVVYSFEARRKLDALIRRYKPDIAHLHNIYHQLSPSILHTLCVRRIPRVMTLHDFKLVCPAYSLMRNGRECRSCAGGKFYRCAVHACLKGSRLKSSLAVMESYLHHRLLHTYRLVDRFIAPSEFMKETLTAMGFPYETVHLQNFFPGFSDPPAENGSGRGVVYFGRLVPGKGLFTLCEAMGRLPGHRLAVFGEGPLEGGLRSYIERNRITNISLKGHLAARDLFEQVSKAALVVFPSECPENNPLTVIEAGALGKPVIAANVGGVPELITHGVNGYLFTARDAAGLSGLIAAALADEQRLAALGRNARRLIEERLNAGLHYRRLMSIYSEAMAAYKPASGPQGTGRQQK